MPAPTFFRSFAYDRWTRGEKGTRGSWSQYWEDYAKTDPDLSGLRMTVELVFGGDRTVRVATEMMQTRSEERSEVFTYLRALQSEPEVSSSISLGGGKASLRSLTLSLDGRLVKALEIVNSGRMLAGWGEISLQIPGGDYDKRIVLLRGDMSGGVEFGAEKEIVTFEVVDPELSEDRTIPWEVADTDVFPNLGESYIGFRYPLVLTDHPAVPCIRIDEETGSYSGGTSWLVCSGHVHTVSTVYVDGVEYDSTSPEYPWSQENATDSLGRQYLHLIFAPSGTGVFPDGATVYAGVTLTSGKSPGLYEIVETLIADYSEVGPSGINYDLLGSASVRIPSFVSAKVMINGSGSGDTTRAIEYLESTLSGEFPMLSFAWTGGGFSPVVVDRRNQAFAARLVRGQYPLCDRASDITEAPKSDLVNSFTYRYAFDLVADAYAGVTERSEATNLLARISSEMAGTRDGDVVESVTVYDSTTAGYVADWYLGHYALPYYEVVYSAFSILALTLRLGDNVTLTDDKLGWSEVPATVMGLSYGRGRAEVRLFVWLLYADLPSGAASGTGISVGGGGGQSTTTQGQSAGAVSGGDDQ